MGTRIVLTGASGFLGSHTLPVLEKRYGKENVSGISSKDYDLTDPAQVRKMFDDLSPEVLVHLAAYVGGIGANASLPADFFHINNMLTGLAFEHASRRGIRKLVYPIGGCCYPHTAPSPISESEMWNGYPQAESAGYAMAKKVGVVASESYRQQHGLNSVIIVPGNMYGEHDNYSLSDSHVIPATIRKVYEAKRDGRDHVTMWGTGVAQRDFVYAGDVAETIPFFIDSYESAEYMNISTGTATSIRELAETVKEIVGYGGEIRWDSSKPDGQLVKIFDTERMAKAGIRCATTLREGLRRTIEWFSANYGTPGAIRL